MPERGYRAAGHKYSLRCATSISVRADVGLERERKIYRMFASSPHINITAAFSALVLLACPILQLSVALVS